MIESTIESLRTSLYHLEQLANHWVSLQLTHISPVSLGVLMWPG